MDGYHLSFGDYDAEETFWMRLKGYTVAIVKTDDTEGDYVVVTTTTEYNMLAVVLAPWDEESDGPAQDAEPEIVGVEAIRAVHVY